MNDTIEKRNRAKRSDIDAMQDRFDAIVTVVESVDAQAKSIESDGGIIVYSEGFSDRLALIKRLADGNSLDEIINEAGRTALGLPS